MAISNFTNVGKKGASGTDPRELFKLEAAKNCLEAFDQEVITRDKVFVQNIMSGKGASFPILGRQSAAFLPKGASTDDIRLSGVDEEIVININGLLVAPALFWDLDTWMDNTDKISLKTKDLGKALARGFDQAVFAAAAAAAVANTETIEGVTGVLGTKPIGIALASKEVISEEHGLAIYNSLLDLAADCDDKAVPVDSRFVYMKPKAFRSLYAAFDLLNRNYGAGASLTDKGRRISLAGFEIILAPSLGRNPIADTGIYGNGTIQFPAEYVDSVSYLMIHNTAIGAVILRDIEVDSSRRSDLQADEAIAKMATGFGCLRPEAVALGYYPVSVNP